MTAATLTRPTVRGPRGPYRRRPITARIRKWVQENDSGCWIWTGTRTANGYGQIRVDYVLVGAHRASYEAFVGPIADGLELDHTCHTDDLSCAGGDACPHRPCCNPAHLEPVTQRVNWERSRSISVINAQKTHCIRGHALTPENLYPGHRGRSCITCARVRAREHARRPIDRSSPYCRNGHYLPETGTHPARRTCRACARAACDRYNAKRRAVA